MNKKARSQVEEYAAALDELERRYSAGQISQGRYEVMKQDLLKEAGNPPPSLLTRIGIAVVVVVIGLVIIRILFGG